jgi:hypothetical protein
MLGVVDSELDLPPDRRREIDARLEAIRARLKTLRERESGWDAIRNPAAILGSRVAAAQRYAAEAHAAAGEVLASSAAAFGSAAEAHERVASVHERAATAGSGDVPEHERQVALHRAAAAADWRRAERALVLLSDFEQGACGSDQSSDGVPIAPA